METRANRPRNLEQAGLGLAGCFCSLLALSCAAHDPTSTVDAKVGAGASTTADGSVPHEAGFDAEVVNLVDATTIILQDGQLPPRDATNDSTADAAASCEPGANGDLDKDGFAVGDGDCDDCDDHVNPGAFDVPGNGVDEDCSGKADDEVSSCDEGLAIDTADGIQAARALDLCKRQAGKGWGLVQAEWVYPDGTPRGVSVQGCTAGAPPFPLSHGVLGAFGTRVGPRQGKNMVAISSGVARAGLYELPPSSKAPYGTSPIDAIIGTCSKPPQGFPRSSKLCGDVPPAPTDLVLDGIALELTLKVPTNAVALSFDFDFYASEFPNYVCSMLNDSFVALLSSAHPATPADRNISFDSQKNPVSVANAFMEVCRTVTIRGRSFACPRGPGELEGTGFGIEKVNDEGPYLEGGATGWLNSQAPVVPGETIKLRFAIWDTGDTTADATALLDNFKWIALPGHMMKPPEKMPDVPITDRAPPLL